MVLKQYRKFLTYVSDEMINIVVSYYWLQTFYHKISFKNGNSGIKRHMPITDHERSFLINAMLKYKNQFLKIIKVSIFNTFDLCYSRVKKYSKIGHSTSSHVDKNIYNLIRLYLVRLIIQSNSFKLWRP
jgi:hypothetical protein